jgi:hypothetical protein
MGLLTPKRWVYYPRHSNIIYYVQPQPTCIIKYMVPSPVADIFTSGIDDIGNRLVVPGAHSCLAQHQTADSCFRVECQKRRHDTLPPAHACRPTVKPRHSRLLHHGYPESERHAWVAVARGKAPLLPQRQPEERLVRGGGWLRAHRKGCRQLGPLRKTAAARGAFFVS